MSTDNLWNYDRCREQIDTLRGRLGFPDSPRLEILGLTLDRKSGILDDPSGTPANGPSSRVFCILATYARAEETPEKFQLIPFRQLPGGPAYDAAFQQRAVLPLATLWSANRAQFSAAMGALGGIPVAYADYAWKIPALPRVPVYILIGEGTDEFAPSAAIFFDASVPAFLETEAAALLGELVTERTLAICSRIA